MPRDPLGRSAAAARRLTAFLPAGGLKAAWTENPAHGWPVDAWVQLTSCTGDAVVSTGTLTIRYADGTTKTTELKGQQVNIVKNGTVTIYHT
jgi:hypothetical protein